MQLYTNDFDEQFLSCSFSQYLYFISSQSVGCLYCAYNVYNHKIYKNLHTTGWKLQEQGDG